jgi:hypothetical protein
LYFLQRFCFLTTLLINPFWSGIYLGNIIYYCYLLLVINSERVAAKKLPDGDTARQNKNELYNNSHLRCRSLDTRYHTQAGHNFIQQYYSIKIISISRGSYLTPLTAPKDNIFPEDVSHPFSGKKIILLFSQYFQ